MGAASEMMRIEIMKKGKLPSKDRYKQILKKKMEENKKKALGSVSSGFSLPGSIQEARKMSKRAEQMLEQIAQKKANKEAKALQKMVIIDPRRFSNGNINAKGQIFDIAGNMVAKVNKKNGNMATMTGWGIGKYKPRSYFTNLNIQNAINLHSPYFINLRKQQMAAMEQGGGVWGRMESGQDTFNVHGPTPPQPNNYYGEAAAPPRQNIGMTAWGAMSDNVLGTFTDNTWGTVSDNVWGGTYSDVWGGIGAPSMWGQRGPNIWNTGSGKNYLRGLTKFLGGLFGFSTKQNRRHLRGLNAAVRASSGSTARAAVTRR